MSLFPNANNILISGGVFTMASDRGDYVHHSGERMGQQFMDCPILINLTHIHLTHIQRLKFLPRKLHPKHFMMAQDANNVQNVTLVLVRKSSSGLQPGSTIPIPSLNFYGFTGQPVLERLRSPQALQKFAKLSWE